jgi:hypothetical protein
LITVDLHLERALDHKEKLEAGMLVRVDLFRR